MSDTMLAVLGGLAGLAWAVFANVVILPRVLRSHANAPERPTWMDRRMGRSPDRAKTAWWIAFAYRFQMPILFTIVGAVAAVSWFGED